MPRVPPCSRLPLGFRDWMIWFVDGLLCASAGTAVAATSGPASIAIITVRTTVTLGSDTILLLYRSYGPAAPQRTAVVPGSSGRPEHGGLQGRARNALLSCIGLDTGLRLRETHGCRREAGGPAWRPSWRHQSQVTTAAWRHWPR